MSPLADRMRPKTLDEYIGQKHILAPDKLLYRAIKNNQIFSMIFWGPPGVGKTTLARIIANELDAEFMEFSAVTTGITEIKKIFEDLSSKKQTQNLLFDQTGEPTVKTMIDSKEASRLIPRSKNNGVYNAPVIFIDEIHRFNKAQQDAFLPYVESGLITLIGATTENPSFEIINPLLSRARVFVLNQLTREELEEVINRALKDKENGLGNSKIKLKKEALDLLIEGANGDGRQILNALEIAATSLHNPEISSSHPDLREGSLSSSKSSNKLRDSSVTPQNDKEKRNLITKELIEEALQHRALAYDKNGEEHYNTISAFIKSMRASNVDAALYYLARMVEAGEDPLFIARRMVIFASEDIGMAQPTALVVANEVFRACETIGYPECQINLAHGVTYLASAKKDRSSYEAYFEALADVKSHGNLPIPVNLRNAPTKLMKAQGYGKGYKMYSTESLLPEKLKNKKYFKK